MEFLNAMKTLFSDNTGFVNLAFRG